MVAGFPVFHPSPERIDDLDSVDATAVLQIL